MKKQLIYLLASACLLAAGCSTENKTDETGYGTLAINCTADTSIDTASAEASGTPEAPAAGAFSLTVTGETGTQKWDTLTEFEQSQTVFRMYIHFHICTGKRNIVYNIRSKFIF